VATLAPSGAPCGSRPAQHIRRGGPGAGTRIRILDDAEPHAVVTTGMRPMPLLLLPVLLLLLLLLLLLHVRARRLEARRCSERKAGAEAGAGARSAVEVRRWSCSGGRVEPRGGLRAGCAGEVA